MFSVGTGVKRATFNYNTNTNGATVFTAVTDCIATPRVSGLTSVGAGNFPKALYVQVGSFRNYILIVASNRNNALVSDSNTTSSVIQSTTGSCGSVFLRAGESIRALNGEGNFSGEVYVVEVGQV